MENAQVSDHLPVKLTDRHMMGTKITFDVINSEHQIETIAPNFENPWWQWSSLITIDIAQQTEQMLQTFCVFSEDSNAVFHGYRSGIYYILWFNLTTPKILFLALVKNVGTNIKAHVFNVFYDILWWY